ncbi:ribonuclease HII [Sandarakinorhabdus oryzae]|uniref:ribonuclease HII n=1 Tax=Sandarakinorhabdus oryzae TaxID=2675220 RepID=UPI0012E10574|nr:ribonuclease HII [Sandarakinorhabdus oryzae]
MAGLIAGVDEAGRGPWAGPVVAAAVILRGRVPPGLDDSKKLSAKRREALFHALHASDCLIGVGQASVAEIDHLNILQATWLAMTRAVEALGEPPAHVLVDGNRLPKWRWPATAIIGGDGCEPAISAASIIAKVTRDRIMAELDRLHPGYGWAQNQGYGVAAHAQALNRLGATPHHRASFAPVKSVLTRAVLQKLAG